MNADTACDGVPVRQVRDEAVRRMRQLFPQLSCDPPVLYAWNVEAPATLPAAGGVCGVTNDRAAAVDHVRDALTNAPAGAYGKVREVRPSLAGCAYLELGAVAEARRTGRGVSWI